MPENQVPGNIPQHVLEDLDERTIKHYLSDAEFRRDLLSRPEDFSESHGLSPETIDWIKHRVQAHGIERLLGTEAGRIAPM